jgi:hypothetical protein
MSDDQPAEILLLPLSASAVNDAFKRLVEEAFIELATPDPKSTREWREQRFWDKFDDYAELRQVVLDKFCDIVGP